MSESTSDTELPPGRELDAMVAEKVLGWRWIKFGAKGDDSLTAIVPPAHIYNRPHWQPSNSEAERFYDWDTLSWLDKNEKHHWGLPHYSTDIAAVQEVKQKMAEMGWDWFCLIERPGQATVTISALNNPALPDVQGVAETAPHAICLAALSAVRAEGKEARP